MDIDGSNSQGGGEIDIDQNLLMQFSCMNTTDREELIRQMQKLLGPTLNYNKASFFLDMNNWNLQGAICSYLDIVYVHPSMSVKYNQTQDSAFPPGARLQHNWTITNTGADNWPGSCRVVQAGGEPVTADAVYVPPLAPGHCTTVTMEVTAPATPGNHRSYFHLVNDRGDQIGDTLWLELTVESETTIALVQQLAAMPVPSSRPETMDSNISQTPSQDDQMC